MRFVQHPSNNRVLSAPAGHNQQAMDVGALPVTFGEDAEGHRCIVSFWKPVKDELSKLLQGKPIMLFVYSPQHPVVAMGVEP